MGLFDERDPERMLALIEAYPFGMLIARDGAELAIAQAPFLVDRASPTTGAAPPGTGVAAPALRVHFARGNPAARAALAGGPVTVVFRGPDAHVSAGWYASPREQVPTWNYALVQAHGHAEGPLAKAELRALLNELSRRFEGDGDEAWRMGELDEALVDGLMAAVVGFRVRIKRLEGRFKLSQNRSAEDHDRVARALESRGSDADRAVARLMRERGR